jgi:siroheme synthase-like protein
MKLKEYYPLFMDIEGEPCLVVGGGRVAERKVMTLLAARANVSVVSPDLTPVLSRLLKKARFRHIHSRYRKEQLRGMRLVIGGTGDASVNAKIFRDAEARGIPSNIVDTPRHCRFILPAVIRHRGISIAICTHGSAPAVSAIMKNDLQKNLLPKYALLVRALRKLRPLIKAMNPGQKQVFWEQLKVSPPIKGKAKRMGPEGVLRKRIRKITGGIK